jgi:hypothetical protein
MRSTGCFARSSPGPAARPIANSTSQVLNRKKAKTTSSYSPGFAVNFGKFAGVEMSPRVYVRRTMARSNLELQIARSPVLRYGLAVLSVSVALGGSLLLERLHFHNVADPLFLLAIAHNRLV